MMLKKILGEKYKAYMLENLQAKKISDNCGINYLSDVDIAVCNYVIDNLIHMDIEKINPGRKIDRSELIDICLSDIGKLGNEIHSEIQKKLFTTPIIEVETEDIFQLGTGVRFDVETDSGIIKEDSGCITEFRVPTELYEIVGYFFGHEQLHAMKDVKYEEYKNIKVLGEVIPIFYEFMIYNPDELMKKEVIKERMKFIFDNALEYDLFKKCIDVNELSGDLFGRNKEYEIKKQIYEYIRTRIGCYANSFYYALILYNMYKETPQKILNLVSKVLKHEITTMEMLNELGIYGEIRGEIFEKELQNVRKLVRK